MSEWISVEERLPPIDEKVLCYCKDCLNKDQEEDIQFGIYFGRDRFCICNSYIPSKIIAWMPLPKPPKYANASANKQTNKQTKE